MAAPLRTRQMQTEVDRLYVEISALTRDLGADRCVYRARLHERHPAWQQLGLSSPAPFWSSMRDGNGSHPRDAGLSYILGQYQEMDQGGRAMLAHHVYDLAGLQAQLQLIEFEVDVRERVRQEYEGAGWVCYEEHEQVRQELWELQQQLYAEREEPSHCSPGQQQLLYEELEQLRNQLLAEQQHSARLQQQLGQHQAQLVSVQGRLEELREFQGRAASKLELVTTEVSSMVAAAAPPAIPAAAVEDAATGVASAVAKQRPAALPPGLSDRLGTPAAAADQVKERSRSRAGGCKSQSHQRDRSRSRDDDRGRCGSKKHAQPGRSAVAVAARHEGEGKHQEHEGRRSKSVSHKQRGSALQQEAQAEPLGASSEELGIGEEEEVVVYNKPVQYPQRRQPRHGRMRCGG